MFPYLQIFFKQEKLRDRLRSKLYTISQMDECIEVIHKKVNSHIVLIAGGSIGEAMVPHIHDLPQLVGVFIYCFNKKRHIEWTKHYNKVASLLRTFLSFA